MAPDTKARCWTSTICGRYMTPPAVPFTRSTAFRSVSTQAKSLPLSVNPVVAKAHRHWRSWVCCRAREVGSRQARYRFDGADLLTLPESKLRALRGNEIALVFQNPMTTLNPTSSIGTQFREVLREHTGASRRAADDRAVELLKLVDVSDPKARLDSYPHQLSGGLRQRVMIALALSCDPKLLIADEATTALDVTTQAQILRVLRRITSELGTAILVITHSMGVVAGLADRVAVMYAGRIVEIGSVDEVFYAPQHPYTVGLLGSIPRLDTPRTDELASIEGRPPSLLALPPGCPFADRCWLTMDRCVAEEPTPVIPHQHSAACWADPHDVRLGARDPHLVSARATAEGDDR